MVKAVLHRRYGVREVFCGRQIIATVSVSLYLTHLNVFPRPLKALNCTIQSAHVMAVDNRIVFDDDDEVRLATTSENSYTLAE